MKPCADCGEPTEQTRCDEHRREARRHERKDPEKAAGYDWQWRKLSRRARALQPFCTDCHATSDLQADHTPAAWARKERGLAIRLQDIAVRCGDCNRKAGAARGTNVTRTDGGGEIASGSTEPEVITRTDGGGLGLAGKAHQPDAKAQTPSHTTGGSR